MQEKKEIKLDTMTYISGVMDEETRPIILSALNDLNPGEGMLVIFRLPKDGSSDHLLEFNISDFCPSGQWDAVSDQKTGGPLQQTMIQLADEVNRRRLPNIVFSQGDEKVKATDEHQVCFGIMSGEKSGIITKIKTIVHQQLNMGLNGDLLLHESNLIMKALYNTGVLSKNTPLIMKSYGAGGSASHKVHPGDILTSDAVIDIRTHVSPLFILDYLKTYLTQYTDYTTKKTELKNKIEQALETIEDRFLHDDTYASITIVSDIEKLIDRVARFTQTTSKAIVANIDPEKKEYYGEICVSNSSQGTRMIKRVMSPNFLGDAGQKLAKKEIVTFMNKMGAHEKNKSDLIRLTRKLEHVKKKYYQALWKKIGSEVIAQNKNKETILNVLDVATQAELKKLEERKTALEKELREILSKQQALHEDPDLQRACIALHEEIESLKNIEEKINPRHPFIVTASGNIFFNHAEKESVHQFGAVLVEMENQLFKQTIHKMISEGCYISREFVTKIAADPVCIPAEATEHLNAWAKQCTMSLDDYVEAYLWATAGKKQDMQNIPRSGLWAPANEIVHSKYPCGLIRIDANPLAMSHRELKELLGNTPSYIIFQDKFFYADDVLDVEEFGPATDETRELITQLGVPYNHNPESHMNCSLFREINSEEQHQIEKLTKHRHRATYERLFYSLCSEHNEYFSEFSDSDAEGPAPKIPQILNPFWKEIGVDLINEIENGKAFSGTIFKNPSAEDQETQSQLKKKAGVITRSSAVKREDVEALFKDYLSYMIAKIPKEQLDARDITLENGRYPIYARHALYKTGYVSGAVHDWDAAIYKANNSAVLVDIVDAFLNDDPVHSVDQDALIPYHAAHTKKEPSKALATPKKTTTKNKISVEASTQKNPKIFTMRSFEKAIEALFSLQQNPQLDQARRAILNDLVDTLLKKCEAFNRLPSGRNKRQALDLLCKTSIEAIEKTAQTFKKEPWIWLLVRPILNGLIRAFNALQSLIFKQSRKMGLFEARPTAKERATFDLASQIIQQSCETDVSVTNLNL